MPSHPFQRPLLRDALDRFGAVQVRPDVALFLGDALEILAALPAGSVDLIFADPPYGLSNGGTTNSSGRRVAVDKGAWDRSPSIEDYLTWTKRWLRLCQRLLRPTGTIWISGTHHSLFAVGLALQLLDFNVLNLVTWAKRNATPNLGCRQLTHSAEWVAWAAPRAYSPLRHVFNYAELKKANGGKQLRDFWELPAGAPKVEKIFGKHPTQKPLELLERIIRASSLPGQLVLDPFLGSGTTAIAARELGRQVIGIEQHAPYYNLAMRRLGANNSRRGKHG